MNANIAKSSAQPQVNRRMALRGVAMGGAATVLLATDRRNVGSEPALQDTAQCLTSVPPLDESGIAFVPLVSGVVRDMPSGPIEVRLSRLAMAEGTVIEAGTVPYPALMYIESGTTACPGAAGRMVYAPDGTLIEKSTRAGVQYTPAGSMQYIPAGIPDGAGNEGPELMSSLILEFVPTETDSLSAPSSVGDAPSPGIASSAPSVR